MFQHILVPLDGSKLAESALPYAEEIGTRSRSKSITLLHVLEDTKGYKAAKGAPATHPQ